jgi:ornithine cyclodeaminase/alanine dehydrogenase-like protein (mu-crystallin family)
MADVLVLSADDVVSLVDIGALIEHLATAFVHLSRGVASAPPRSAAVAPAGQLAAMPGYVPGMGLTTKLISTFPDNRDRGLPAHQGLIAVFDEYTGTPVALIDGTLLTALRTAAASALSAKVLVAREPRVLAIVGAGAQGRAHLDVFAQIFQLDEIRIVSRNADHARQLSQQLGHARYVDAVEDAVRGADIICCCTASLTPVLNHAWVIPGAHVTSVGTGPEVDPKLIGMAGLFVESRVAFQPYPAGCRELQGVDSTRAAELGEVLGGLKPGRSQDDQITFYKSMGHAVEDTAAADLVVRRAKEQSRGTVVSV